MDINLNSLFFFILFSVYVFSLTVIQLVVIIGESEIKMSELIIEGWGHKKVICPICRKILLNFTETSHGECIIHSTGACEHYTTREMYHSVPKSYDSIKKYAIECSGKIYVIINRKI